MAEASRLRRVIPYGIFCVVLMLGLALALAVHVTAAAERHARLSRDADNVVHAVEIGMAQHVAVLRAVKAMLEVDPHHVTQKRFASFIAGIDLTKAYPAMRGVGFGLVIGQGDEEETQRSFHLPRYIHPATTNHLRAPVVLLEPRDSRNDAALAFDLYSEERRRTAMTLAERSGKPVATAPLTLRQEITPDVQAGFLVFLSVRDEAGKLVGFASAPFRLGEFLTGIGVGDVIRRRKMSIDDVTQEPASPLFSTIKGKAGHDGEAITREVEIATRRWRIAISPAGSAVAAANLTPPLGVAALALILAYLVARAYRDEQRAQEIESALGQSRLKALADREILLQEMNHRIKNAIARIGAIARSTARASATLEEFQASFSGRLVAMANAQDLASRANQAGASLEQVLRAELGQLFGADDARLALSGPPTQLDARLTQALALVFHELATNAAKHGAARDASGRLAVTWRGREDGGLSIEWDENVAPREAQTERKGFGSRLIKLIVEGELKGSVQRDLRPEGLRLRLEIPPAG